MSRIGKRSIPIPGAVTVQVTEGTVAVEGPRGTLSFTPHPDMRVQVEGGQILCQRPSDEKFHRSLHGLTRTLLANMVAGVTQGFDKKLELVGVGYRAAVQGRTLTLTLGYSHPIVYVLPPGITVKVENQTQLTVSGADKQVVGEVAATLRRLRPPEPYKGKGIKYVDERIRRKAGKTGA